MIEFIQISRNEDDGTDCDTTDDVFSPFFIWVVRDFSLSLNIEHRPCTADEYLEHALNDKPGARNFQRNEVRKKIREFFPTRRCFTLKRFVLERKRFHVSRLSGNMARKPFFPWFATIGKQLGTKQCFHVGPKEKTHGLKTCELEATIQRIIKFSIFHPFTRLWLVLDY